MIMESTIQKLNDQDPSTRRSAAEELAGGDERAIYPLIRALSDKSAGVQEAAMRSLIAIGGEVVGYMVLPLLREDAYLRNTALTILTELGEVAVPLIYPLLKDRDADIRKFAIDLLVGIKEGVDTSRIVPCLKDLNANVRTAAAKAFGILEYREAIPALIEALRDEEWVCFSALQALGELKAVEAIESILQLISSPLEAVRFVAIETLGKLGPGNTAIPSPASRDALHCVSTEALLAHLPSTSGDEKNAVIKSLIQIGITPEMSGLSTPLITMLKEGEWEEKEIALKGISLLHCKEAVPIIVAIGGSLDTLSPESEERISFLKDAIRALDSEEYLLKLLSATDVKYRGKSFAIELLGEIRSKKAVPCLVGYLHNVSRDLRRTSAESLGEIGECEATKPLIQAAQHDEDAHVRRAAVKSLGNIQTKEAFLALIELLGVEKYYDIKEKIVEALIKIDAEAFLADILRFEDNVRELVAKSVSDADILLMLADDPQKKVKLAALYGLGRGGTEGAVSKLIPFLKDSDPDIRKAAVVGLGEAKYAAPELFAALQDNDPWVRFYAVKSIAFSCAREEAFELIRNMLNDEFIPVVMSVVEAMKEIGGREAYEALAVHEEHPNVDVREKIQEALRSL